eukprot:scaffold153_cov347-Pavlova_lutheri.AAC.24
MAMGWTALVSFLSLLISVFVLPETMDKHRHAYEIVPDAGETELAEMERGSEGVGGKGQSTEGEGAHRDLDSDEMHNPAGESTGLVEEGKPEMMDQSLLENRKVLVVLAVYVGVALVFILYDEVFPIFCAAPTEKGGLNFSSQDIGHGRISVRGEEEGRSLGGAGGVHHVVLDVPRSAHQFPYGGSIEGALEFPVAAEFFPQRGGFHGVHGHHHHHESGSTGGQAGGTERHRARPGQHRSYGRSRIRGIVVGGLHEHACGLPPVFRVFFDVDDRIGGLLRVHVPGGERGGWRSRPRQVDAPPIRTCLFVFHLGHPFPPILPCFGDGK